MKYIAYGSNLDEGIMLGRCKDAKFLGTGVLEGYRLMFKGEEPTAYATIEQWDGYRVPYVLWEITPDDERKLDSYEGYPKHYVKQTVMIKSNGEKFLAMFYQKPEEQSIGQPMTHYVEVLSAAYEQFDFDRSILDAALKFSDDYYQNQFRSED